MQYAERALAVCRSASAKAEGAALRLLVTLGGEKWWTFGGFSWDFLGIFMGFLGDFHGI